jgi:hypothetical protein
VSAGLHLRVNLSFRGEDLAAGTTVVANVYPANRDWGGLRDILIPAGDMVEPTRFEVPAGRYVVEVVMPSGKLLSQQTKVDDGQEVTLDIDDWDSPRESHSWQYFSGNLESGTVYRSPLVIPRPRSSSSRYFDRPAADVGVPGEPAPGDERLVAPATYWIPDSRTDGWSFARLNQLSRDMTRVDLRQIGALIAEGEPIPIPQPTESDGTSHLYRFDERGPLGPMGSPGVGHHQIGARQFLVVTGATDGYLVTLPSPWRDVHYRDVLVEVLVNARQSPTGSPVGVTVRDRAMGAGLGYLASGALSAAGRVFEDVEQMLYSKVTNPLAAAAGAYVLLGTESDPSPKPWHDWVWNLRSWFGWMSDGSILWAAHTLRTAETNAQIDEARAALVEAYQRGVPFYTLGLSWLIDGLSDFPEDDECQAMLKEVQRLSWRVDTRQPFVVLGLTGRPS